MCVGLLALVGCNMGGGGGGMGSILAGKVSSVGGDYYSIFHDLMKTSAMDKTVGDSGPYTVFAPTNDAFNALPQGTVQDLKKPQNRDRLVDLLSTHIVRGRLNTTDISAGRTLNTVNGRTLTVDRVGGQLAINGARIVQPNINASNGIVHGVDKVLTEAPATQPAQ
jgi:uncharacterized surface protein with fasciclin (FAS1) repeats